VLVSDRVLLTAATLAVLVGLSLLMVRGWRARAGRQRDLPPPPRPPATPGEVVIGLTPGLFVGTTFAGDWLDRVTAHGLGVRGPARLVEGGAGLLVLRPGARGFSIARADLLDVRCAAGIANRLAPRHLGVVVVTWRLGERELDTGFQPRDAADRERIEQLVTRLVHQEEATP